MVRILSDSACDLTPEQAKELGVDIIPNIVTFPDGVSIRDNVDMTSDEFYRYMEKSSQIPTTSHPSPDIFMRYFEDAKSAGDSVVVICISSELSSLYNTVHLAAQLADFEDYYAVDSLQATLGQQIQVLRAVQLRNMGNDASEIFIKLEREKLHTHSLGVVEDLNHLHRGGRLNMVAAITGMVLGIKPLIEIKGKVCTIGKARGWRAACDALIKKIDEMGGLNPKREYMLGYTLDPKEVSLFQEYITEKLHLPPAKVRQIGAAVGTHVGPGTFGFVFYDNKPNEL